MRNFLVVLGIFVVCVPATTQTPHSAKPPSSSNADQQAIANLEKRIESLENRVQTLESQLKFEDFLVQSKKDARKAIMLDPSEHTYQVLDSDSGALLVSLVDVSPYLNGYRVKINIGNPNDARFANAAVKIRWAKAYDWKHYSEESYKQWQSSIQEKITTLNAPLTAGTWNPVNIDLVPCDASQTGYLQLSIDTPSVLLGQGPAQ